MPLMTHLATSTSVPTPLPQDVGIHGVQPAASAASAFPRWDSRTLLEGAGQAEIMHGDQVYRLRLTALGKLILTK